MLMLGYMLVLQGLTQHVVNFYTQHKINKQAVKCVLNFLIYKHETS